MKKKNKIFLVLLIIISVLVAAVMIGNRLVENKIKTVLKENLQDASIDYEQLEVSLLTRSLSISKLTYKKNGKQLWAEKVELASISVLEYLFHKNIEISKLVVSRPEILLFSENAAEENQEDSKEKSTEQPNILINSVEIADATFKLAKNDSVKEQLFSHFPEIHLREVVLNKQSRSAKIPFIYKGLEASSDSLFFNMNDQHDIFVSKTVLNNDILELNGLKIKPLYSKQEFPQHIPYEKDRVELRLDTLAFNKFNWGFKNDSLHLESEKTRISGVGLALYRDKQVKDDPRQKPMYSKMIRELPFGLELDTVLVEHMQIQYEEMLKPERGPGKLSFKNLHACIYNLSNTGMGSDNFPRTYIEVETMFMGEANLKVNWNFDISNNLDFFVISGQMDRISSEGINQFMVPALNIKTEGGIRDMKFNFSGNDNASTGEMKMVYDNFKVEVLKKDGTEKNNLLSTLANLIINNEATTAEKEQTNIKTQRTKTKSFWNYLWKNIRNGALKSFL